MGGMLLKATSDFAPRLRAACEAVDWQNVMPAARARGAFGARMHREGKKICFLVKESIGLRDIAKNMVLLLKASVCKPSSL